MNKIINFIKKIDTFVDKISQKVPYLIFDAIVIICASILTIFGLIFMIIESFWFGLIFIIITYGISTYLIMTRHKKHIDKWIN